MKLRLLVAAVSAALAICTTAQAGPVIIDGTDANDHGSVIGGVNQDGWLYMQKALQNLASTVSSTVAKNVTVIGTASGAGQAFNAIQSAFNLAGLSGWTITYANGATAINAALGSLSTSTTGILYISTCGNTTGDMDTTEMAAVNGNAANIANYVGGAGNAALGGALFTQGESCTGAYGWLTSLIPSITPVDVGGGGIGTSLSLTAAGTAAFPGLTNADLSSGPWHGYFGGNLGSLSVLATAPDNQGVPRNVIIGGGVGTTITQVPEPSVLALLGLGLAGLASLRRRRNERM